MWDCSSSIWKQSKQIKCPDILSLGISPTSPSYRISRRQRNHFWGPLVWYLQLSLTSGKWPSDDSTSLQAPIGSRDALQSCKFVSLLQEHSLSHSRRLWASENLLYMYVNTVSVKTWKSYWHWNLFKLWDSTNAFVRLRRFMDAVVPGLSLGTVYRMWLRNFQNQWHIVRHLFCHATNVDDSHKQLNCWLLSPKCQSVHGIVSPSIFRTTPWGCGRGRAQRSVKSYRLPF